MQEKNESGPKAPQTLMADLYAYLDQMLGRDDLLILSGSLLPGLPDDAYRQIIHRVKAKGAITFLDTSKEALKQGIEAGPHGIKPNHHEWELLWDEPFHPDTWQSKLSTLHAKDIKNVFVTCGKDGAYASDGTTLLMVPPLSLNVQSTVGAGDAFVAGWAMAYDNQLHEQFAWASAIASATTQTPGTTPPDKASVQSMHASIIPTVKEIV